MEKKMKLIAPVIDYNMFNKVIKNNKFTKNFELHDIDNKKENNYISKCYNAFLNSYDYSKESWFVFCHEDFEFLEDVEKKISNLSKKFIYGPIGVEICFVSEKRESIYCQVRGGYKDKNKSGLNFREYLNYKKSGNVSTVDCMCMIIHSSLIKKHNLRFDENLTWNLYVEDFCISSMLNYNIKTKAIEIDCCHWSQLSDINERDSYAKDLNYLNINKYKNNIFVGTCGLIGKKYIDLRIKYLDNNLSLIRILKYNIKKYVQKFCL